MAETQPMMLQALCYTATDFRLQLASLVCSEGVADATGGALLVTTGGAGLDLSVAEGGGFVASDVADQGMYWVYNDAPATVTATAADATNPRIDQVIATVNDSQIIGVDDDWVLSVLAGTPTVGATLTNLNGATALPDRSIRLAYILVPATFAGPFVNATHILDARTNYSMCDSDPYVSLQPAAATSIPNTGVFTQPTLGTVVHRDADFFTVSGATITVVEAGLYDIQAANGIAGDGVVNGIRRGALLINNTNLPSGTPDGNNIGPALAGAVSGTIGTPLVASRSHYFLAAGSTIKAAYAQNSSAGALNSEAGGPFAHLTVRKVG